MPQVNVIAQEEEPTANLIVGKLWFQYSTKIWRYVVSLSPTVWDIAIVGGGDMTKAVYDSNEDGLIGAAQLTGVPALPLAQSDVTNLVADLGVKTTLVAVKADSDVADAITKKHSNALDHSNSLDHTQNTDQGLDSGGANAVTAAQTKTAYTHSQTAHAPSGAQVNADITKAEIEAKLTGEIASHTHAGGGGDGETTVVASGDTINATTTLASATGMTFTAVANSTYIGEVFLLWNANTATVGIKVSATASNSPVIHAGHFITDAVNGTPDSSTYNANSVTVTTSASSFTTYNMGQMAFVLKSAAGTNSVWQLQFAAETTGTITCKVGSTIRIRKVT